MSFEIGKVHSVNGHKHRAVEVIDDISGFPIDIINEVLTPHCGWNTTHICEKACDTGCYNAKEFFDEVGIEY